MKEKKKEKENKKPETKNVDKIIDKLPNNDEELVKQTLIDVENEETQSEGENLTEILKAWLDDAYIHAKTRLNQNQIIALTILKTLAEKYKVNCIKELIDNFVRYKLSEGGQSSKELVDILKSRTAIEDDDSLSKAVEPFLK